MGIREHDLRHVRRSPGPGGATSDDAAGGQRDAEEGETRLATFPRPKPVGRHRIGPGEQETR